MNLPDYLKSLPDEAARRAFGEQCDSSIGYMRNVIGDPSKKFGAALCVLIERNSFGVVTRQELRDDWPAIWPELSVRTVQEAA